MAYRECVYKNATIRIHYPDRAKEERDERIREATRKFLKKVEHERRKRDERINTGINTARDIAHV